MSVPDRVSQSDIQAMNKIAEKNMQADGFNPHQGAEQQVYEQPEYNPEIIEELPISEEQIIEQQVVHEEHHEEQPVQPAYNKADSNWKAMRERAERAEREKQQLLDQIESFKKQSMPSEVDTLDKMQIDDDTLIEGRHLKEIAQELKQLKATVKNYESQSKSLKQQTVQMRLESQFPDINKALTDENIYQLQELEPDLFEAIVNTKDEYKKGKLAYTMVKQLGIYKDQPTYAREKLLVQQNNAKPKPMASLKPTQSDSPLSKINAFASDPLSKEGKEATWLEMQRIMNARR